MNYTPRKLKQIKADIIATLHLTGQKTFTYSQLAGILVENRTKWGISELTMDTLLEFLVESKFITVQEIEFPSKTYVRYVRGTSSIYTVLLSLHQAAYFTHHTAMHFHKLTKEKPDRIYLNIEQRPKSMAHPASLLQENMNKAFSQRPRITKNISTWNGYRIYLLNGMHTGQLGVQEMHFPRIPACRLTSIERTLIDIAVRPIYSGGVTKVLEAYVHARNRASVNTVVELLTRLNYVYPYHQAIGFYMERAGYDDDALETIRKSFSIKYDFYLVHEMKKTSYSAEWRLYFPETL